MVIALFATTTKTKHKNVYHFEYVEKSRGPTSERSRPTVHRAAIERDAFGPRTDPLDIKHVDRTVAASYVCVCDANCCFFSVFFRFYNYIESGSPCHAFDLANDFRFAQIVYVFAFSFAAQNLVHEPNACQSVARAPSDREHTANRFHQTIPASFRWNTPIKKKHKHRPTAEEQRT